MTDREIPLPGFFKPDKVSEVWRVPYQERAKDAEEWAKKHDIKPASYDRVRINLLLIDVQNTFCIPDFELYVGGRSGTGAVDDNKRLCEFIYKNLSLITTISPTMDTHQAVQIFHSIFLINKNGKHPQPFTLVSVEDIKKGIWKFNPESSHSLGITADYGQDYIHHYVRRLKEGGKYDLTIWPYHAILGGIGNALVSSVEEVVFFHSITRHSQPNFQVKGDNPFTENYSVLSPEVLEDFESKRIAEKNARFFKQLISYDALIIAGQAKSHCVAWTIDDILKEMLESNKSLAEKIYILEDCMSPVVVPGIIDYTDLADETLRRFADNGMHIVRSTDPVKKWPGMNI